MSTWGIIIRLSQFCMFEIFHYKFFLKSTNALMWSFTESFDIRKGILGGRLLTIHCGV